MKIKAKLGKGRMFRMINSNAIFQYFSFRCFAVRCRCAQLFAKSIKRTFFFSFLTLPLSFATLKLFKNDWWVTYRIVQSRIVLVFIQITAKWNTKKKYSAKQSQVDFSQRWIDAEYMMRDARKSVCERRIKKKKSRCRLRFGYVRSSQIDATCHVISRARLAKERNWSTTRSNRRRVCQ